MVVLRVARKTTVWTKAEHRDPKRREPIFRDGERVRSAGGMAAGDVVIVEDEADGGTRVTSITGGYIALALAVKFVSPL